MKMAALLQLIVLVWYSCQAVYSLPPQQDSESGSSECSNKTVLTAPCIIGVLGSVAGTLQDHTDTSQGQHSNLIIQNTKLLISITRRTEQTALTVEHILKQIQSQTTGSSQSVATLLTLQQQSSADTVVVKHDVANLKTDNTAHQQQTMVKLSEVVAELQMLRLGECGEELEHSKSELNQTQTQLQQTQTELTQTKLQLSQTEATLQELQAQRDDGDDDGCSAPFELVPHVGCVWGVDEEIKTWDEARISCWDVGAELYQGVGGTVLTAASMYWRNKHGGGAVWVGVKNRRWIDGVRVTPDEWWTGQPDGQESECGYLHVNPSYRRVYDDPCTYNRYYLCHRPMQV